MTTRILIMGLPGAGKTTLSAALTVNLFPNCLWLNADAVREKYDDWDFSHEGRIRQSIRMRQLADESDKQFVIADFVAPLPEMRKNFDADWTVWVDTIGEGRFEDTNKLFVPPDFYDFRITTQDAPYWSELIAVTILSKDNVSPTRIA